MNLKVLASMRPVEGSGVAMGHPHEALATQHSLDRAVPCSRGLPLQSTVRRHWQPAQHHLSQSAVQHKEPLSVVKLMKPTTRYSSQAMLRTECCKRWGTLPVHAPADKRLLTSAEYLSYSVTFDAVLVNVSMTFALSAHPRRVQLSVYDSTAS